MKFLTLNLYEGGLFFDNIINFLHKENPDIVAFQEVNDGKDDNLPPHLRSIQVLVEAMPDYHYFFAPELLLRYPEGKIDIGNAIFSKFPITNEQTVFLNVPYGEYEPVPIGRDFSKHPKNMQICNITTDTHVFTIANLHGIWGLDGADNPERLHMSQLIIDNLKNQSNVILAGDFNLKPNTLTIQNIEKYLTNVFKDELITTFNTKHKNLDKYPGYATAVVDMVFTSPNLQITNKYVPSDDVSDHLPLVVEIEI